MSLAAIQVIMSLDDGCSSPAGQRGSRVKTVVRDDDELEGILWIIQRLTALHRIGDAQFLVVSGDHDLEATPRDTLSYWLAPPHKGCQAHGQEIEEVEAERNVRDKHQKDDAAREFHECSHFSSVFFGRRQHDRRDP
jgi:hypothetical protein